MTTVSRPVVVWFRDDLRIADNPALTAALSHRAPVIALFVLDEESPGVRPLGGAAKWWLHHSLSAVASALAGLGISLVLRRGPAEKVVDEVVAAVGAAAIFWNRRYGGPERLVDAKLKKSLIDQGLEAESFAAGLLFEPWTIHTRKGEPYSVFTPFWRACTSGPTPRLPLPAPQQPARSMGVTRVGGLTLEQLDLLPKRPDWAEGLREAWQPGEVSGQQVLDEFLGDRLERYATDREIPGVRGSSGLSPHLRWGEISPHQVWHAAIGYQRDHLVASESVGCFLGEIGWREFAWHTLYHFPDLATKNWRRNFDHFPWPALRPDLLQVWQEGHTGIALVDAGMRELWRTGWMHNRVRMVTASFLTGREWSCLSPLLTKRSEC